MLVEAIRPILQAVGVSTVAVAVFALDVRLPVFGLDLVEYLRRVPPAGVPGQNPLLFKGRQAAFGLQRSQQFQGPQIGLDLADLPGRGQRLIAYSVISLWLW